MEDLFTSELNLNGRSVSYRVFFDNDRYNFVAGETMAPELPAFSFKREEDEWHEQEVLPANLRKQALDALENYLLKQH